MFKTIQIDHHQRGLRFREGHFVAVLPPGRHTVFSPSWDPEHERVEVVDVTRVGLEHPRLAELLEDSELRRELLVVDVAQGQRGRVFRDGKLFAVLPAGRYAFWRGSGGLRAVVEAGGEVLETAAIVPTR